jgi:hypothetical protein
MLTELAILYCNQTDIMITKKPVSYKNRRIINTEPIVKPVTTDCTLPTPPEPEVKQRADKGKTRAKYDNTLPTQYLSYLKRANRKGISFDFTPAMFDTITSQDCVYCGGPGHGIDRIDSSKGYTIDNSVPCCTMCNLMKYTHTKNVFLKHVQKIYEHNNS